jgi:transcriptional regulator with XRE-family HTH domain
VSDLFSERLKSLRGDRNKAEFARVLGIPAPMYHRYEDGQVPKENNLRVIAERCGVTIDWLLGREGADSKSHRGGFLPESPPDSKSSRVSLLPESPPESKGQRVALLPPGPMRTIGSVSGRELLYYREADEKWLLKEAAGAVDDIPKSESLRQRLGVIGTAIDILVELQERCVDQWTGRKRGEDGKREE